MRSGGQTVTRAQSQSYDAYATRLPREPNMQRHGRKHSAQLGAALILLGTTVLATIRTDALTRAPLLGWLIVASGVVELAYAFRMRRSRGFFLHLIPGIVSVPIGLLVATQPVDPTAWTLMFASFLIIVGLFRILAAVRLKFGHWMWALVDGTISVAFGILVWARSPWLGFRYLGIAVGISLILRGWSSLVFALGARGSSTSSPAVSILERGDSLQSELSGAARNKRKASA